MEGWTAFWAVVAVLLAALAAWVGVSIYNDWPGGETDVTRQVTNFSYAADAGVPVGNSVVLKNISVATNSTFAPPTCMVDGRNVFNPANVASSQVDKGITVSYAGKLGVDEITLPPGKVTHVYYAGKAQRLRIFLTKVVMYYDQAWDSLWVNSAARGPKDKVIACMKALSPAQRGLIGLVKAVVFLPAGTPVPAALR